MQQPGAIYRSASGRPQGIWLSENTSNDDRDQQIVHAGYYRAAVAAMVAFARRQVRSKISAPHDACSVNQ